MKKIVIADDHPMIRGALTLAVTTAFGRADIFESSNLAELLHQLKQLGDADLVLLDLKMPGTKGFEGLTALRTGFPSTPVVIISAIDDPRLIREAIDLGAAGFISKSTPRHEIVAALHRVASGGIYVPEMLPAEAMPRRENNNAECAQRVASLTPQQRNVLRLLGTGKLNKEIAYELDITETTVKAHVSSILHKLKVYSRTQAVVLASKLQTDRFEDAAESW